MSGSVPSYVELLERLARVEARIAELEAENLELKRRLGLTSRNSSKPPSSDGLVKPPPRSRRESSGRAPGEQPGDPGFTLRQVASPDEVVVHRPGRCEGCGDGLDLAPVVSVEARQVFDLEPVRMHVTEHRIEHRCCDCGTKTMADVPAGVGAPAQYGPRVRAIAAYLVGYQHLPLARAAETLADLLGVGISPGTLVTICQSTADGLAPFLAQVCARLAAAPVAHFDETGLRVAGAGAWVHSASTLDLSLFTVHPARGHEAIRAAGVLPWFQGIAVHDGFTAYRRYGATHQLCNAHHLRELAGLLEMDPDGQAWAEQMIRLLCELNDLARYARERQVDAIGEQTLASYRHRYHDILDRAKQVNPDPGGNRARSQRST